MIRVLIVDDSAVARQAITNILESDSELKVIGYAKNGVEGVEQTLKLKPDIITMDIYMPKLDGYQATKEIMRLQPTPIIAVSASVDSIEMKTSFRAINAGALGLVEKPLSVSDKRFKQIKDNLITKVKIMSAIKLVRRWQRNETVKKLYLPRGRDKRNTKIIAVGSSTGGPSAVNLILKQLPKDFKIPIVIVQHITAGFSQAFADWLSGECQRMVRLAEDGRRILPGDILIAPDNTHFGISVSHQVSLADKVNYNHHRPSVNYLFDNVAKAYGSKAIALILTGMGNDGCVGIKAIKMAGGRTIAQDEASSVVFGMPKAAIKAGVIDEVVPIDEMVKTILRLI